MRRLLYPSAAGPRPVPVEEPARRPEYTPGLLKAVVALGCLLTSNAAFCEQKAAMVDTVEQRGGRLLTRAEGAALVDRALEYSASSPRLDCSHLVHEVLTTTGLAYPYATSNEIFAGIPQFRRVRSAQPGDLIVWPGHVGLVVDTERSEFLSSKGSGIGTDNYSSEYWQTRGRPRFYRYVVGDATELAGLGDIPARSGGTAPAHPTLVARQADDRSSERLVASQSSPQSAFNHVIGGDVPLSMQIATGHGKPTKGDVEGAVSALINAPVSLLDAENRGRMPVVLLGNVTVVAVHIKGDKGWAGVRGNARVAAADGSWGKATVQELRWELRREQNGWRAFMPRDRLYVSQGEVIAVLAKQLAVLSAAADQGTQRREMSRLAAALNLLLNDD
ncbi:MAG TPA: NlpC/P60 family protein [Terriglobales bacterium]|nr:NlpC/P60 family protein [Terriglobales bacterium]